jgi:membrane dipeptidase
MRTIVAVLSAGMLVAQTRTISEAEVRRVHRSAILIDTHNDVTSKTVDGFDVGEASKAGHTDIPRMRVGGLGAQFFAAYVATRYTRQGRAAHRALEMIDTIRHDIAGRHSSVFELALTADDIERIHQTGRIAALIGIEGGDAIEDSLRLLRQFYRLGARSMTLTHAADNNWAGSSGAPTNKGLSEFGKQVVSEMNRLGMMIDVSHVSDRTFWDVVANTRAPVIASHSSCRALSDIPRNMSDEMIRALAKNGGVIQINAGCQFLTKGRATLADVVAHIDHVKRIAGADWVGLGSDFDGVSCTPTGLADVSEFPNLTRALLMKGYSAGEIHKIYGGNLLRVMRAVEQIGRVSR